MDVMPLAVVMSGGATDLAGFVLTSFETFTAGALASRTRHDVWFCRLEASFRQA
ncbi:hypothetical protein [Cyanobium sp. NS01]|jgi:hypothetical protein|uniref:hypothetical protein n=1 Tax=Cyanobium sp. NS01 TaxID=261284 RepID=UPI001647A9FE|nr:hypothetical protein [Cyanobium sp. NS01]MBE9154507.1 hypothetical protein [Cyanobium sp. LEGE 06113]QNI69515.1 hypothetical protein CyaNS01_00355 [Cyanobium sp. NS01]